MGVVYDYISKTTNENTFRAFVIAVIILTIFTTVFPLDIRHISAILIAVALVFLTEDRDRSNIDTFNKDLEFKLNTIKKLIRESKQAEPSPMTTQEFLDDPKNLHLDPDLINLFFNIQDFHKYNPNAFWLLIKACDNVLQLHEDLKKGVLNCAENLEVMQKFANSALNHYHSFVFTSPSNKVTDNKFNRNQKRLQVLLRRKLDDGYRLCKKQYKETGLNINTRVIQNSGPRATNPSFGNFDVYN